MQADGDVSMALRLGGMGQLLTTIILYQTESQSMQLKNLQCVSVCACT